MERFSAVAVLGFLFGRQFRESLLDRRKVEERVVAKSVRSARDVQQDAFSLAAKNRQRVSVPGRGNDAYKTSAALFWGNFSQLANQARVVGLIVGVVSHQMRLVGGISRGMHAWSAA